MNENARHCRCGRRLAATVALLLATAMTGTAWAQAWRTPAPPSSIVAVQDEADAPVTADELRRAIEDIKARVARQRGQTEETAEQNLASELRAANATITELTNELSALRARQSALREERAAFEAELTTARGEQDALESRLREAIDANERLSRERAEELAEIEAALALATDEASASGEQNRQLRARIEEIEGTLETAVSERERVRADLQTAERQAASARDEAASTREQSSRDLQTAHEQLDELERQGREQASVFEGQLASLRLDLQQTRTASDDLARQLEEAQTSLTALEARRAREAQEARERRELDVAALRERLEERETELRGTEEEMQALRDVAQASVFEVQTLGEQLVDALAQNQELVLALTQLRESKEVVDGELRALRAQEGAPAVTRGEAGSASGSALGDASGDGAPDDLRITVARIPPTGGEPPAEEPPAEEPSAEEPTETTLSALTTPEATAVDQEEVAELMAALNASAAEPGVLRAVPYDIAFRSGGAEPLPAAREAVARLARLIEATDADRVQILGHTDGSGDDDLNQQISQLRAQTVASMLRDEFGLAEIELVTEGRGESQPIADNSTADGRRTNRRVEIIIER